VVSDSLHKADENCPALGYCAVSSGNFLPILPLEMVLIGCPETLVRNYHYIQCHNPTSAVLFSSGGRYFVRTRMRYLFLFC
jgi:hypothetical protein